MSFVSRVRSTVKLSAEVVDDSTELDGSGCWEHGTSPVPHRPPNNPPDLDDDELDGEGARAILTVASNLYAAKVVGVNSDFCNLFGYDKADLALATFKILHGPLTNTKHLQEMWADVRKGLDKAITSNMYTKSGEVITVRLEALLKRSECHENNAVFVLRFNRQCIPPHDGSSKKPLALRKIRLTSAQPSRVSSELEMERVLRRLEGIMPSGEMDRLRKMMDNMVPKAKLEAAEAEIARLKKMLGENGLNSEIQRMKKQIDNMVPKEEIHTLQVENDRLQKLMGEMVPNLDLQRAQDHLHEAQEEVNRLKKMLEDMERNNSNSSRSSSSTVVRSPRTLEAPPALLPTPVPFVRTNSEVSRIAGRASSALMEVFPKSIAEAIMEGRTLEPINKECVSVFFSDVVGFTKLSSAMDAGKVSDLLNRLFAKFDALAASHGVQKMDVIGDAYLAATNVMEDQSSDHAARIARFAIDAMAAAQETRLDEDAGEDSSCVQIRIGIHCGAVSASVLGSQGFKYTLLGDTVNTASRMESTSLPCEIQCSESSARLITLQAPDLTLLPREGGVEIKGKGHMNTFWLCRGVGSAGRGGHFGPVIGGGRPGEFCSRALALLKPASPTTAATPSSTSHGAAGMVGGGGGSGWAERCAVRPATSGRLSLRSSRDRVTIGIDAPLLRH